MVTKKFYSAVHAGTITTTLITMEMVTDHIGDGTEKIMVNADKPINNDKQPENNQESLWL